MADSKKPHFPAPPILNIFSWKFHGLVLAFFVFLCCFWAYVGQSHDYIDWATPMPFASNNSTNPRTNPENFHEKISRIGGAGKWGFFESAILIFFFKKKNFFASSQWKLVKIYRIAEIFRNLMITLVSSPKQHLPKDMQHSVGDNKEYKTSIWNL